MEGKKFINRKFIKQIITLLISLLSICLMVLFFARILTNVSVGAESYKADIKINLDKYINFKISDQDKGTLVQYNLKTQIKQEEGKLYIPIKESGLTVSLNQINGKYPYAVKVITKSTELTNGKTQDIQENYEYTANTGTLIIKTSNENENGEPINSSVSNIEAKDEYLIICYYDTYQEQLVEKEIGLKVVLKSTLFEEDRVIDYQDEFKQTVKENIGELTSISYITDEIYNGYIKSNIINGTNYNTQYKENQSVIISKKQAQDKIKLLEDNTFVKIEKDQTAEETIQDLGNNGKLVYKSTKIRKADIINVLGQDGIIEFLDKNEVVLAKIDKNTQFAEDGTIVINYENEPEAIIVKTSTVQNEGILNLENTKEIKNIMLDVVNSKVKTLGKVIGTREEVNVLDDKEVKTETEVFTNEYQNVIDIKDSQTNVEMELNNSKWTNKQQNEIIFDVYVNSNTINDNMLKNPTIRIELPSQVEKVILGNSSVVYANGLKLQEPFLEKNENGNIVIVANLVGEQTQYDENTLGLKTDVKIAATVILNKDIQNSSENVNLTYTNQYTLDGSTEVQNKTKQVDIESYQEQTTAQEETNLEFNDTATIEDIQGLTVEVLPVKGDTVLKDGDTVYEGEFIKYNVKVTNTSDKKIDNIKIIGTIPDGTTYGELDADYYSVWGKYEYNYNKELKEKVIDIGSLESGQSSSLFYEVKVNDLQDGEQEKQIKNTIKTYVGELEALNYVINNNVKQSEVQLFMKANLKGLKSDEWNYLTYLESNEDRTVSIEIKLPLIYEIDNVSNSSKQENINNINISEDNVVTATVYLKANSENVILIKGKMNSEKITNKTDESEIELQAVSKATSNNNIYTSNENRINYGYDNISLVMTSETEGEDIKYQEEIHYKIVVKNIGKCNLSGRATYIKLSDFVPGNLKPISVTYENWIEEKEFIDEENDLYNYTGIFNKEQYEDDITSTLWDKDGEKLPNVNLYLTIPYGESVNIDVKTMADSVSEKTKIENSAFITGNTIDSKTSNIITHTILPYNYEEPDDPINPDEPDNPDDKNEKYSISGIAWLDENEDGKRQTSEKLLEDITVMLVDTNNASIIKDKKKTDSNGEYRFSELEKGNYIVVFNYDTDTYSVTEYQKNGISSDFNSDVTDKEITLSGKKTKVGLTDILLIDASVNNIDIGLVKNKVCDLKLDKYISKVIVKTQNDTKEQTYDNTKLAKVEIKPKEIEGAIIVVEYKIVITNEGELPTSVNKVIDYLPEGLELSSELNKNWTTTKKGEVTNTSISNQKIEPGKSMEMTLIATKTMTGNDTGTFTNIAEIGEISNALGTKDIDSTPGNKVETEDDYSKAELVISISTGNAIIYISIIIIALIILGTIIRFFKLKAVKFIVVIMLGIVTLFGYSDNVIANENKTNYLPDEYWLRNPTVKSNGKDFYNQKGDLIGTCDDQGGHASDEQFQKYVKYKEIVENGIPTGVQVIGEVTLEKVKDNDNEVTIEKKGENYIIGPLKLKSNTDDYTYSIKTKDEKEIKDGINVTKNKEGNITTIVLSISQEKISEGDYIEKVNIIAHRKVEQKVTYDATITGHYKPKNAFIGGSSTTWEGGSEEYWDQHKNDGDGWFKFEGRFYQGVEVIANKSISEYEETTIDSTPLEWKLDNGLLKIVKKSEDTDNKINLPNAKFQIKKDGNLVKATKNGEGDYQYSGFGNKQNGEVNEFVTNENGEFTIKNLPVGEYKVSEVTAPDGYYISSVVKDITIEANKTKTVTIYNKSFGSLNILKRDENDVSKKLPGAKFNVKKDGKFVIAQKINDKYEYLNLGDYVNTSIATSEFITDENGYIEITNLPQGTYDIIEVEAPKGYEIVSKSQSIKVEGRKRQSRIEYLREYIKAVTEKQSYTKEDFYNWWNIITGNAQMSEEIKEDIIATQNILLRFHSNGEELNSYIKNLMIEHIFNEYAKSKYEFYDKMIEDLEKDNMSGVFINQYLNSIYKNAYGEPDELGKIQILSWFYKIQGSTPVVIYNKIARIDISGYVWQDGWNGKTDGRDGVFNTNGTDRRLPGVYIRLVDNNGNIVKDMDGKNYELITNTSGQYKFEKVEIDKLVNYHVEFSYNGMSYQSVNFDNSTLKERNSNKGVEIERQTFNNKFATIQKNRAIGENNSEIDLQYYSSGHESKLQLYSGQTNFANIPSGYLESQKVYEKYIITAKTYENIVYDNNKVLGTGLDKNNKSYVINTLEDISKNNITEITGLNLGVYEREQPDIALHKDVYKATVSVNNKSYDYMFNNKLGERKQGTDTTVGVIFEDKQGDNPYRLPIYRADYVYKGNNGAGKFNASITYKIALVNESTNIYAKVNGIVDYYSGDKLQYSKIEIGGINAEQLTQLQNVSVQNNNGKLRANNLNITIEPGKVQYLYITFNLTRPDIHIGDYFDTNIDGSQAYNMAEITSYSTYSNNNYTSVYGGIDKDSAPDNLDINRYDQIAEDDSDKAPALNIIGSQRQITGIVFEDSTEDKGIIGRLGDGEYGQGEKGIDGVTVILFDNKTGKMYNTTTENGGKFTISNFVAGNYVVQYIWGKNNGGKSTLEYKATIYNNKDRLEDTKWYAKDIETRYSDALDDINDDYLKTPDERTMVSVTPEMDIGIESEDYTSLNEDEHIYQINNVDFGIAERAKQGIEINKFVKEATITLQNGQTVINYNKDNNVTQGVQKLEQVTDVTDEVIWMQLDNELVHGSTLNVTYGIKVENTSEYDYADMDYYNYGFVPEESKREDNVRKITPTVYDYLDSGIQWAEDNNGWEKITEVTNYKEEHQKDPTIIEEWYSSAETTDDKGKKVYTYETLKETYGMEIFNWSTETFINKRIERLANKSILYNSTLTKELKPKEFSEEVSFKASKILSTADEIELNNIVEVTLVDKNKGQIITPENSRLTAKTTIVITPGTGEDKSYFVPIAVGVLSLVILSGGIILIKKKVLK